jgi:hypothetical protein
MNWRKEELSALDPQIVDLQETEARVASRRAYGYMSKTRYGLDETKFAGIDRLDVDDPPPGTKLWLAERISSEHLLLNFDRDEVFRVPTELFLERWQDMFCPSRDDVVILPVVGTWVLYYCHEDEFEFAPCESA